MTEYFLGIDLGGTNLALALIDTNIRLIAYETAPSEVQRGLEYVVKLTRQLYGTVIQQAGISPREVKAMAIASPGPISNTEGKIIKAPNLPAFENVALRATLTGTLNLPGLLDNDANAACWGEYSAGTGQGCKNMVLFTLGTGIGSGVVYNAELMTGDGGNGPELGHMVIYPNGRQCSCGQHGCLEAYASAWAIEQAFDGNVSCKEIFRLAETGNHKAAQIIDDAYRAIAVAILNLRHILIPEKIVLAGGITNAGNKLTSNIKKYYTELIWSLKPEPLEICIGQLGDKAGVIGAACRAKYCYNNNQLYKPGT